jgi:hypothetical protein
MAVNFDVRQDDQGWTVYDRRTGDPVLVDGRGLIGLKRECADRVADSLNEPSCEAWRNVSITGP